MPVSENCLRIIQENPGSVLKLKPFKIVFKINKLYVTKIKPKEYVQLLNDLRQLLFEYGYNYSEIYIDYKTKDTTLTFQRRKKCPMKM